MFVLDVPLEQFDGLESQKRLMTIPSVASQTVIYKAVENCRAFTHR